MKRVSNSIRKRMSFQDWSPVVLRKSAPVPPTPTPGPSSTPAMDDGPRKPNTYGADYGQRVMRARADKKWSQVDLARKMNVLPDVIKSVENGTGIVNGKVCELIFKLVGVKRHV